MSRLLHGCLRLTIVALLVALVTSVAFLAGFAVRASLTPGPTTVAAGPAGSEERAFRVFWEAWHILEHDFYGDLPDAQEMTYSAVRGVIDSLDDQYTAFLDPEMAAIVREDMSGAFDGIGAVVNMNDDGQLEIIRTFGDKPAARAGLKPGDIVLAVGDTAIEKMSVFEAVALIRGPAGSVARLTIKRQGVEEPFIVEVVRQKIEMPIVESRMLDDDIAYLKLSEFNAQAASKLKADLQSLLAEEPRGLIFDLRDNPGGFLDVAVEIGSQFVSEGSILVERLKDGQDRDYPAQSGGLATDIPLVVLVNGASASASEIVAGAIQDADRGILIGEQTLGKGSVQLSHYLSDGSELRVTFARWFTPKGRAIHEEGLSPDIQVDMTEEDIKAGRDPQLQRAIEYLRGLADGG
ncbi:MAG: S41 family peptidase [Dehalococcoidia bacterium]|nr:S41 family peptidase [Dehalococcoidia bacterium]